MNCCFSKTFTFTGHSHITHFKDKTSVINLYSCKSLSIQIWASFYKSSSSKTDQNCIEKIILLVCLTVLSTNKSGPQGVYIWCFPLSFCVRFYSQVIPQIELRQALLFYSESHSGSGKHDVFRDITPWLYSVWGMRSDRNLQIMPSLFES